MDFELFCTLNLSVILSQFGHFKQVAIEENKMNQRCKMNQISLPS